MNDFAVNPDVGLWQRNAVLNGQNTFYVTPEVEGTLSIKTILRGEGSWITPTGRYRVDEGSYLVLNRGQRYSVDIRSREEVETFCVFFKPQFLDSILSGSQQSWDDLLQGERTLSEIGFYERLHPADDIVSPQIDRLRALVRRGDASGMEADEVMMRLANALLKSHGIAKRQRDELALTKASTREEIYRRLNVARDYMISHVDEADLQKIASAANLSPFHFHRLFKSAFAQTPHEFLAEQRTQKAKRLLANTNLSMAEVAWAVGFETPSAFSKFFSRTTGLAPTAYRHAKA